MASISCGRSVCGPNFWLRTASPNAIVTKFIAKGQFHLLIGPHPRTFGNVSSLYPYSVGLHMTISKNKIKSIHHQTRSACANLYIYKITRAKQE